MATFNNAQQLLQADKIRNLRRVILLAVEIIRAHVRQLA